METVYVLLCVQYNVCLCAGKGVLEEGEDVRDEGLAAPPPQLEVVVLNPEQSTQELTHILVDALQRYEQSSGHNSFLSSV